MANNFKPNIFAENVLCGEELHMPIPTDSLGRIIFENIKKHLGKNAFIDEFTGESLTYDELLRVTCQLAQVLKICGLKQNDTISICSENSIYCFCVHIAALYLGVITSPISHFYTENEIVHAVNLTRSKMLFCSRRNVEQMLKLKRTCSFIKKLVIVDFKENLCGTETLRTFIENNCLANVDAENFEPIDVDVKEQVAFVMFSSGTTGLPKGVMLTHKNLLMRIVHVFDSRLRHNVLDEPYLAYLPLSHASGLGITLGVLMLGECTRIFWKFDEAAYLRAIEKFKITLLHCVPPVIVMLAKSPLVREYDLSSVTDIICGAAPVSANTEDEVKKRLNLKYVRQIYGMTELTLASTSVPAWTIKRGSVGKVVPGMFCVVRDPDTGKNLGANQIGELCFKGDLVMKGYYDNPVETTDTFTNDGWLKSGDLGFYDEEHFIYVVDRLKELIKYRGFQVPPAEIEGLLLRRPDVKDAAVIGIPDIRSGELPLAFVVKQNGANVTENELIAYVAKNLSRHKHLRGGVRFIEEIPKNGSGKILRRVLKELVKNTKSKL